MRNVSFIFFRKAFLSYFVFLLSLHLNSQSTANYTFGTNTSGSLVLDANGNTIDMSAGTTTLVAASSDQGVSSVSNIGFNFILMGNLYTQFSTSANGILQLGTSVVSGSTYVASGGTVASPKLSAFGGDLQTGTSGKVHSKLIGTAPNRCLVIEFNNMNLYYSSGVFGNDATFQIRLYETSGLIEYVYGTVVVSTVSGSPSDFSPSIGFSTNTTANNLIAVSIATNTATTTSPFTENPNSVVGPISNLTSSADGSRRVYSFTPPAATPTAPTWAAATSITATGMTLNWTDNASNETGYIVLRSTDNTTFTQQGTTLVSGTQTLVVSGLTPGTLYYWKIIAVREGTASEALGSETTLSGAVYYWTGTATAEFNAAATWNTAADGTGSTRSSPLTTDVLIIDGAGTVAGAAITGGTVNASASIGQLKITSSTPVTLTGVSSTRTLTITGGSGDDCEIQAASTLTLNGATAVAFVFTGAGNTGNISGTLTFGGSTSNTLTTTGGTSTLVTVSSSGIINLGVIGLTSSTSTLAFANGSNCNMTGTQTTVPLATWGATSNLNITGIVGGTSVTNGVQTFGNLTYNCSGATGTMSFFTSSTTAVVQGNLTIQATNSGIFRATTSGTVNILGNLVLTAGTFQVSNSTGTINVTGNVNINGGSFDIAQGGASNLRVAGNFIQTAGTIAQTSTTGTLEFNGTSAQTLTLIPGSHGTNVINARVNNASGVNLTSAFSIRNLTISRGNLTGAGSLAYNGTTSLLTYNSSTGNQTASSVEFPSSTGPSSLTINNTNVSPNNIVTVPFSRTLIGAAGVLTFTAGILDNSTYVLTLSNTATGAISGGSTTTYAKGAIERSLPLSLVSGSTYNFPVGKGSYNPLALVNPTTNAGGAVTVKADVFDTNAGGTSGTNMGTLNTDRYWAASITAGAGNFTNTFIRLNDASVVATSAIGTSATLSGAYDIVGSTNPTIVLGTSVTSATTASTSLPGFYVIGLKAVPMVYSSSTVTQSVTTAVIKPAVNQQIIGVQIVTTGNASPLTLTSMDFNTTGTTSPAADISNARVWYTGTSSTFATTTQFGSDVPTPSGTYTVTGSQALAEGINYFWLVYDVPSGATVDNLLDAECTSVNVGGAQTPSVTAPAGTRIIKAALANTYLIGDSQIAPNYTKLTAAIADLNAYGASAAVIFELQGDYSSSGETFPLQINAFPGNSATNTLTIKPKTGVTAAVSGSSASAIFVINGADYVTIDGSNGSTVNSVCPISAGNRDLTITNTNTSATNSVVWLQTATSDGATNNKVINCNLIGSGNTQTLFGVGSGSSTISISSLGTENHNNIFVNNNISKTQYGVFSQGASAANKNTGTIINQNLINTVSPNNVQIGGILVGYESGIQIRGNNIAEINTSTVTPAFGITLGLRPSNTYTSLTGNEVTGATVSNNIINGILRTGDGTAMGIAVSAVTSASSPANTIANNMVAGVRSTAATPSDFPVGILIGGGAQGSTKIYYNTVSLTGVGSSSSPGFALAIGGSDPVVDIRNNILVNKMTSGSGKMYAIGLGYSTYTNLTSNNNDFYTSASPIAVVGGFGFTPAGDQTTLATWTATTGKDGASKNVDPVFVGAPGNLHMVIASNPMLDATGIPVSVTEDIDCDMRNVSTPDIGADEFNPPIVNDLSLTALTSPANVSCFSASENVIVQLTNSGNQPWDFSTFSRTVSGTVTNGSPASFGPITITNAMNGGVPLAVGATMTVTIGVLTNMQTPQVYTFNASLDASGDESGGAGSGNDALSPAVTRTSTNPTVTLTSNSPICDGSTLQLTATSAGGNNNVTTMYNGTKTESPALTIPDNNATGVTSDIILSGSGNITNTTPISVTININHTFVSDLDVYLVGPGNCGAMELTTDNGLSGDNYTNTILNTTLSTPLITGGTAPFTGSFKPEGSVTTAPTTLSAAGGVNYVNLPLTSLVAGTCPINGTWKLYVGDAFEFVAGTLNSWSISITNTENTGNYTDVFSGAGTFGTIAYSGANNSVADVSVTNPTETAYTVTTTDANGCASAPSSIITPTINALPSTPVISSPLCHGATSVSGTSAEADGTTIEVFVDAVSAGTTTVTANVWTKTGLAALIGGNSITSSANNGVCTSILSTPVVVGSLPTSPVLASPICPGTTAVSGTSTEANGTVIEVFVDAVTAGTTTVTANAWTKTVAALSTGNVITATATSAGCVSNLSLSVTVSPAPALPSINSSANQICPGTSVTFTAGSGSQYEFFKNAVSLGSPSRSNTYTTAVLANNDEISVRSYSPFTFDGNIIESPWGTALATSAGGALATDGFGIDHQINAIYVQGDANNINMAVAGNVRNGNRILVFIDSKTGGYTDGNFGRAGAPEGIDQFNQLSTFDAGFEPDYCLVIGTNGTHDNNFFDLYELTGTFGSGGGPSLYLGDRTTSNLGAVTGANPLNSDNTRGFEVAIPKLLLGYISGTVKVMAMYTADDGWLNNQFLTKANSGEGAYTNAQITFGAAAPDPITVTAGNLINNCYSSASVIMQVEGTIVKNSADAGFNTLRSVYNCIIDGGPTPITYDQPTTISTLLTNPLTINKTLTIMGAGPGNKPEITVDFTGLGMSPGIMIGTGKTVTLTDVDIKDINNTNMPNNAVIEVQGTGTLKVTGSTVINKIP